MKRKNILASLAIITTLCCHAQVKIKVTNNTSLQRQELVSCRAADVILQLGLNEGEAFCVKGPDGQVTESQLTHDGEILFDASVRPNSSTIYTIDRPETFHLDEKAEECMKQLEGTLCTPLSAPYDRVWTSGRLYPDRLDDIAWENDRGAYRIYGPAFEQSGAKGYGPDVWTKNTPEPEMEKRFRMDIDVKPTQKALADAGYEHLANRIVERNTFHKDHGTGYDAYAVGPTLGCGGNAIITADTLLFPSCWREYEILDNGPLRFKVKLRYADVVVDGNAYKEYRIYSLDKGSNFNRIEVWYEEIKIRDLEISKHRINKTAKPQNLTTAKPKNLTTSPLGPKGRSHSEAEREPLTVVTGFPLHSPGESTLHMGKDYMQYADPTDAIEQNSCELYIGCLFPYNKVQMLVRNGHALATLQLSATEHFVYYAGSAWSKADVRNQLEWQCRINSVLEALLHPLAVNIM